jgi:hypothetical protein
MSAVKPRDQFAAFANAAKTDDVRSSRPLPFTAMVARRYGADADSSGLVCQLNRVAGNMFPVLTVSVIRMLSTARAHRWR